LNGTDTGIRRTATVVKSAIAGTVGIVMILLALDCGDRAVAAEVSRFVFSGDGQIDIYSRKNGLGFTGRYRTRPGVYDPTAIEKICRVFDAPYDPFRPRLSLRLLEYIDYLEDHHRPGARVVITSGYRSPEYNTKVRKGGGLAAKASLHQYGMAADFMVDGVSSREVWETVKTLRFGGAGYYHGETLHVDVGPARSWDENSSGVGTGISDDNKLIDLVTDFDVYLPGEEMTLRFTRMTAFPIGVNPVFFLDPEAASTAAAAFEPELAVPSRGPCPQFHDIEQMDGIRWRLPRNLAPGRYSVRARFCDSPWAKMPREVRTPVFEVVPP
jgi:uncharacterized protein YcbK (DUF882 family)